MARMRSSRPFAVRSAVLAVLFVTLIVAVPAGAGGKKIGISARVSGAVKGGAVSLRATCNVGCATVRAVGTVSGPGIGTVALVTAVKPLTGGKATLALSIPARVRSKIRSALARGRRVTASLRVTGLDAAGRALVSAAGRVQLGP